MPQVSATVPARQTGTIFFEWPRVVAMRCIADLDVPLVGECHCIATVSCRHHAVEQIDSAGDRFQQIDRPTYAHQVPGLIDGQHRTGCGRDPVHLRRSFTDAEAAHGEAFEIHAGEF